MFSAKIEGEIGGARREKLSCRSRVRYLPWRIQAVDATALFQYGNRERSTMGRQRRSWLNAVQKAEIWKMWREGESLSAIARMLERQPSAVYHVVNRNGGISPPARTRSARALSPAEREEISRALVAGRTMGQIALQLGRSKSTISRAIGRNGGIHRYRAHEADANAWERARRPKACALSGNALLRRLVAAKLKLKRAPVQIAGWLRREFRVNKDMQISHETIYRSLFIQARWVLKKELVEHLRTTRTMRPGEERLGKRAEQGQDNRSRVDQRKASRGGGPCGTGPLGRRSAGGLEQHLHCHTGGAALALCDAGQGSRQGHCKCGVGADKTGEQTAETTARLTDMGLRYRDGEPQELHDRHERAGVFLRSAKPMATRQQREHVWPAASVLPQRQASGRLFAGRLKQGRGATERSTPPDLAIYDPCRETGGNVGCCNDRLNPP
jgi:DNA-binding CsgD family transcriptional regulator